LDSLLKKRKRGMVLCGISIFCTTPSAVFKKKKERNVFMRNQSSVYNTFGTLLKKEREEWVYAKSILWRQSFG